MTKFYARFPSPTGVNYYEFSKEFEELKRESESFRPQQGLTIMNEDGAVLLQKELQKGFRPQQGLTIMNMCIRFT